MSNNAPGLFRRFFSFIGNTLKNLFKSILTLFIRIAVLLILVVILVTILVRPAPIPDNVALRIAPQGNIVEQLTFTPPMVQLMNGGVKKETLLRDLTDSIDAAASDDRINSIVLDLGGLSGGGLTKLEELSVSLQRFKESGKKIVAVGDNFDQSQYYLASHADEIYLNPFGAVEVTGFARFQPYFKGALDKLKVNVHVFKVGSYKDAVEPFMFDKMSEASRQHNSEWVNALWNTYSSRVESLRELPKGAINEYIRTVDSELVKRNGDTAQLALDTGLVDGLKTRNQMQDTLIQLAGSNGNGSYAKVGMKRYLTDVRADKAANQAQKKDKIAVVVAKGGIQNGDKPSGTIGGDSLAKLLRKVRNDPAVDALVFRVDSPGGSAYASEVIRQEILQIKDRGIPVIVSMGTYAASGGYWISANADQIWAAPTTLTGSIGVFGLMPTLELSMAELGINTDGVSSTDLAGFGSPMLPMSAKASRVMQSAVDGIYGKFLALVAEGRHSNPDAVHEVAQGRVWTGARAKELGLVDQLGNLEDAIDAAAEIAGIEDYRVEFVEKPLSFEEQLMRELSNGTVKAANWMGLEMLIPASVRQVWSQTASPLVNALDSLNDPKGYYLRCYDCSVE